MKQKVLVIVGPTSSGKSALAVEVARKFDWEVISADSRQVYCGLDIGTGKITKREMKGVPHHLLNVASPKKMFTAHDVTLRGRRAISDIARRGKLPIIVGGTGFYIDALVGRIALPDVPAQPTLRERLQKKSTAELFALLKKRDPRRAKTIDRYNKRRLIRALEIAYAIGNVPYPRNKTLPYMEVFWIGLHIPKHELEQKIEKRLTARIKQGMAAEAKRLHKAGLSYKRMEELGLEYRSLARLLQKKITRHEFEEELFRAIKHYAKRQMTYWRRNREITWFDPNQKQQILKKVRSWRG